MNGYHTVRIIQGAYGVETVTIELYTFEICYKTCHGCIPYLELDYRVHKDKRIIEVIYPEKCYELTLLNAKAPITHLHLLEVVHSCSPIPFLGGGNERRGVAYYVIAALLPGSCN
jgi:hypothetical protein